MKKIKLANTPTGIEKLESITNQTGVNLYIKRDDYTGTEFSGNKIRKLEYAIKDAIDRGCDTVITAGAIQSNHCRATAAAAAKFGLRCELVIRGDKPDQIEGNLFLDYMLGANVHMIDPDESREEVMEGIAKQVEREGGSAYLIPVGASNSVGSYGYKECFDEILTQEKEMGIVFDAIVVTVGSGGSYAGLWYGNYIEKAGKIIFGISVSDTEEEFKAQIIDILKGMEGMTASDEYLADHICIEDGYIGEGYALSTMDEICFLVDIARSEGIIFDPCYTGKAFRGCVNELKDGRLSGFENVLFIHTGGLMGWTEKQREMALEAVNKSGR